MLGARGSSERRSGRGRLMKIGIYGGTFNPVHYGHLRTAEDVFEMLSLDMVLFVPSGITPFDKPDLAAAAHRYNMVKAAIRGNARFRMSDIEVKAGGRSYTVDTVRKLKEKHRRSELYFIIGIDAFLDLPGWKRPDELVGLANFVIISRPGYGFSDLSTSPYLKKVPKSTLRDLDSGVRNKAVFDISGERKGCLCGVTALDISASRIRSMITAGKSVKYLLPDSVKSYIISNKLYLK